MSTDDTPDGERGEQSVDESQGDETDGHSEADESGDLVGSDVRERLGEGADRAVDQFDDGLIDLLAWILETETRARIYISLRNEPDQTSDEIAERTGLYPSTVREALASLHEDDIVTRSKRQNAGAGNNPYEYSAIPPSDLVSEVVDDIQHHLNAVFNLDNVMDRSTSDDGDSEPVTITVTEEPDRGDKGTESTAADESTDEGDSSEPESDQSGQLDGDDEE